MTTPEIQPKSKLNDDAPIFLPYSQIKHIKICEHITNFINTYAYDILINVSNVVDGCDDFHEIVNQNGKVYFDKSNSLVYIHFYIPFDESPINLIIPKKIHNRIRNSLKNNDILCDINQPVISFENKQLVIIAELIFSEG